MVAIPKQAGDTLIDTTTSLGQGFTKSLRKQSVDATGGSLQQVSLIYSAFSFSHHLGVEGNETIFILPRNL